MRRGGVLILLIGLIVIVGAVMLFLFLQGPTNPLTGSSPAPITTELPTEVPVTNIVRARFDIAAKTLISDTTQLEVVEIPQTEFDPDQYFSDPNEVLNKIVTRVVVSGEPIQKKDLVDPGLSQQIPTAEAPRPRDKAYPFVVNSLSGVADQIKIGDFVDVVATFNVIRRESYPTGMDAGEAASGDQPATGGTLTRELSYPNYNVTKTIIQQAEVLKIIRPQVAAADATPAPDTDVQAPSSSLPQVDASGQPISAAGGGDSTGTITQGAWTLILAVNNQEIELIEFALTTNARTVLVLRGAGDSSYEPTIGATFDLLVAEFGLPLPQDLPPNVVSLEEALTPQPTRTPAPTRVP